MKLNISVSASSVKSKNRKAAEANIARVISALEKDEKYMARLRAKLEALREASDADVAKKLDLLVSDHLDSIGSNTKAVRIPAVLNAAIELLDGTKTHSELVELRKALLEATAPLEAKVTLSKGANGPYYSINYKVEGERRSVGISCTKTKATIGYYGQASGSVVLDGRPPKQSPEKAPPKAIQSAIRKALTGAGFTI